MTDKQIIIDYKTLCENYSKEVGCYNTFDGRCNKEQCFTYKLLQLLQDKDQECEELKRLISKQKNAKIQLSKLKGKQYKEFCDMKQTLAEIKEIAETAAKCFYATKSDDYADGYRWLGNKILQKISEVENDTK